MSVCKRTEHPPAARRSAEARPDGSIVETDIPARLDRLPWGRFHTLVVVALGILQRRRHGACQCHFKPVQHPSDSPDSQAQAC
jgi:hypothetical protein